MSTSTKTIEVTVSPEGTTSINVIRRAKTGHSSALQNRPPGGGYWVEESSESARDARVVIQEVPPLSVVRSLGGRIRRSFPVGALAGFGGAGWPVLGLAGLVSSGAWRSLSR